MRPFLSLWYNLYYQSYRFNPKLREDAPITPYELSYLTYRFGSAHTRMSYAEFMRERQELMNRCVAALPDKVTYSDYGACVVFLVWSLMNCAQLILGVNLLLAIKTQPAFLLLFAVVLIGGSIAFQALVVLRGDRYKEYFARFSQESPGRQCLRRWGSLLLAVLLVLGAFPLMALL